MGEAELMKRLDEAGEDLEGALAEVHRLGHAAPTVHLRVHRLELALRWRQGRYAAALWQCVALVFAVPVSWLERSTGISRL